MRLRNKKTGEIEDYGYLIAETTDIDTGRVIRCSEIYESIAELNEEWEDYEPKEPLIRDKNTREAVRAWAKVNSIEKVVYTDGPGRTSCILTDMSDNDYDIEFVGWIPTLEDGEVYTITELCGEAEE